MNKICNQHISKKKFDKVLTIWEVIFQITAGDVTKKAKSRQHIMSSANMRRQGLTYGIELLSGSEVELFVNKLWYNRNCIL